MKLFIHCGLHKTGTTSFQNYCYKNRDLLRKNGVLYPSYKSFTQHSYVLWDLQKSGSDILRNYFSDIFLDAKYDCQTVILSGEDFENCIVDTALACEIEELARASGFQEVNWVIVARERKSHLISLYSELIKHNIFVESKNFVNSSLERGCIYVFSEGFNYIFVTEISRFIQRFRSSVSGSVIEYDFEEFIAGHPGMILLEEIFSPEVFNYVTSNSDLDIENKNERIDSIQVEANYISVAFGISALRRKRFRPLLMPLIWLRLRKAQMSFNTIQE